MKKRQATTLVTALAAGAALTTGLVIKTRKYMQKKRLDEGDYLYPYLDFIKKKINNGKDSIIITPEDSPFKFITLSVRDAGKKKLILADYEGAAKGRGRKDLLKYKNGKLTFVKPIIEYAM
ncbi:hypothetical protein [Flammeovirga kamogawensis]|uniref:Uncharacterized protein n=1 Tax=Flammeovirga kamogawensis TaxID=373891 RepID=A0ABX8GXH0_9BACT|nr:hypothetical protein [Flammeovirga kamogawensis]MBB6463933.1 hypothetical protein [Flammeovirga kamogawensis]QWG08304.1 hypothetical protein KM029_05040 [Flammeovirga kamogawensis]TRX66600.1 hypothetical protein EO216_00105 [Flammeovirga kamogawensis]